MSKVQITDEPFSLTFAQLSKHYVGGVCQRLSSIGIDRYYYIIQLIHKNPEKATQQWIAEQLSYNKTNMVRVADYLCERGFITRKINPQDRREHVLILTEKAEKVIPLISQTYTDLNNEALKGFSDTEKDQFIKLVSRMHENVTKLPGDMCTVRFKITKSTNDDKA